MESRAMAARRLFFFVIFKKAGWFKFVYLWIWGFVDLRRLNRSKTPEYPNKRIHHFNKSFTGVGSRHTDYKWGNDAGTKRMVALRRLHLGAIYWPSDFLLLRLVIDGPDVMWISHVRLKQISKLYHPSN